jgi:hypothetical protein
MPETTAPHTGGDVKLPGGAHVKKQTAILIAIVGGVIAAYFLYRQRQASKDASQTSGSIDPQTGYAYGSPEDQSALAALGNQQLPYGADSGSFVGGSVIGYDAMGNPIYGQGQGGGSGIPGASGGFSSNTQWSQAAEGAMGSTGADAIAAALGKYLLGLPLTDSQVMSVQQAIAAEGFPPVPGPGGFPPSYKTSGGGGSGGGGGGSNPKPPKFTTVAFNGTLAEVAKRRGWPASKLREVEKLNGMTANERVYKGQRLRIA